MLSDEELRTMKGKIQADVVDDDEDLVFWLFKYGAELMEEILAYRAAKKE